MIISRSCICLLVVTSFGCVAPKHHIVNKKGADQLENYIVYFTNQSPESLLKSASLQPLGIELSKIPAGQGLESYEGQNSEFKLGLSILVRDRTKGFAAIDLSDQSKCISESWVLTRFPAAERVKVSSTHSNSFNWVIFLQRPKFEIRFTSKVNASGANCISSIGMYSDRFMYPVHEPLWAPP